MHHLTIPLVEARPELSTGGAYMDGLLTVEKECVFDFLEIAARKQLRSGDLVFRCFRAQRETANRPKSRS